MKYPALEFDGVDDYVDCGSDESLDFGAPVTLAAWINPPSNTAYATIVARRPAAFKANWGMRTTSGKLTFYFGDGSAWHIHQTAEAIITLNEWQHVAASYDGANVRMYRNGVEVYSAAETATPWTGPGKVGVGRVIGDVTEYFYGLIAEVRIYNRALTADEIKQLYYHKPITNGLVLWLMPQRSYEGGIWWDRSGYGNHGTIYGATPSATEQFNLPPLRVIAV